jgi:hypothetical protein
MRLRRAGRFFRSARQRSGSLPFFPPTSLGNDDLLYWQRTERPIWWLRTWVIHRGTGRGGGSRTPKRYIGRRDSLLAPAHLALRTPARSPRRSRRALASGVDKAAFV